MAKMLYQGHGSLRFTLNDGSVIYFDPYAGEGYDKPADYIFVTHQHHDHNCVDLMPHKEGCVIISEKEALKDGVYQKFDLGRFSAEAVEAYNKNHKKEECVGFVLTLDGKKIYCSGDTSTTDQMSRMAAMELDYALFPTDGFYNMGPEEASACAKVIKAKVNIPIHMAPGKLFDPERAELFEAEGRLIVAPGEEIEL